MNKKHLYILTAVLALIGGGVLAYRAIVLEFPLTPRESTETWRVEARIEFEGRGKPARVELKLPTSVPTLTVFESWKIERQVQHPRRRRFKLPLDPRIRLQLKLSFLPLHVTVQCVVATAVGLKVVSDDSNFLIRLRLLLD